MFNYFNENIYFQALAKALEIEPTNSTLEQEKNNINILEKFKDDSQQAYDKKDFRKVLKTIDY
jgi:hypothetical protein